MLFIIFTYSPLGRARTLYEFILRVATENKTCELPTADARLALLRRELLAFRKLMTETSLPSISFRSFFEELVTPSADIIPVAYNKEGGGIGNVLDDIASMLFQTLSKHKVEFEFRSDRDFVNMGICMLCDVVYL